MNDNQNKDKKTRLSNSQFDQSWILKTGNVWIHKYFPLVKEVKVTDSMAEHEFIFALMNATNNADLKSLNQLEQNLNLLKKKNNLVKEKVNAFYSNCKEIDLSIELTYKPFEVEILLNRRLVYLEVLDLIMFNVVHLSRYSLNMDIAKLNSMGWSIKN